MDVEQIFEILWKQYSKENPSVEEIHRLFQAEGEEILNDHVAFRTFNDPRVGIDVLSKPFIEAGYKEAGQYHFQEKKLFAKHFELDGFPRVFISELLLEEFSIELQQVVKSVLDQIDVSNFDPFKLIVLGKMSDEVSYKTYEDLRKESEYAAWLYAYGYRANHFTVSINHLKKYNTIEKLNDFIKKKGFFLNSSGGEIKGSQAELLEQSSTLADRVSVKFSEGIFEIPSCYYEFACRYPMDDGALFSGFIAGSADKIFESTDFR